MSKNFSIERFLDLSGYDTDVRKSRRKNSDINTQEFFTPYSVVKRMADKISDEDWADSSKTFLEPCFGNGQFICYIVYNRIMHGVSWEDTLKTLYGVELMQDNVDETRERVLGMLEQMGVVFDRDRALDIMSHNLVCSDFFEWDFKNWTKLNKPLF